MVIEEENDFIVNFQYENATKAQIEELQKILVRRGYYVGGSGKEVDGIRGNRTKNALKSELNKINSQEEYLE
ncbi:MAG: peptidoglycan-binding protein [Candidatus Peribacteria bacterium]|jgi:hypothetical protein|nr:peptidoglycan-binding protein [Candidatus Peribacteria bacterium]